mmetsp:Transcript_28018/g.39588  ORF Transcript_28018/g.39588 Transcript_28018/m.39588 type:complete len:103 (+) Transcript_28018:171-479(+)
MRPPPMLECDGISAPIHPAIMKYEHIVFHCHCHHHHHHHHSLSGRTLQTVPRQVVQLHVTRQASVRIACKDPYPACSRSQTGCGTVPIRLFADRSNISSLVK